MTDRICDSLTYDDLQLERFWMQANIPVSILAGCGVWCVYNIASDRYKSFAKELRYLFGFGALLIAAHQIVSTSVFTIPGLY